MLTSLENQRFIQRSAIVFDPFSADYSCSQNGALASYARTWAAEFKTRAIRVNTLSPGVTDTPILDSQSSVGGRDEVINMYLNMIPLGRLADAVEIANAAVFLGSDQSSYVTGSDLMADGGVGQV